MHDPHPAQLQRLMKEGFSVWSRTTSFLSEEHSHRKLPVSSCGATPTAPARRYLRRGRRVTGRGRSETSPTGTDPHSHLRDTNCHHMHTFSHSTECVSVPHANITLHCRIQRSMYMWKSCRYTGRKHMKWFYSNLLLWHQQGFLTQRNATHWIFSPFLEKFQ